MNKSVLCVLFLFFFSGLTLQAEGSKRVIHVFVALCDNDHQGIVKVPPKIGNGDDPDENLYWGCDYGLRTFFKKSPHWKFISKFPSNDPAILERVVFRHLEHRDVYLVADAYRGQEIKLCTERFLEAASGNGTVTIPLPIKAEGDPGSISAGGEAEVVAYIGHDGLMDFHLDENELPTAKLGNHKPVILLCCAASIFFGKPLDKAGAWPLVWTTQLMCPEAYTLEAALEGWTGKKKPTEIADMAATAYSKYQKCGFAGARHLLVTQGDGK